MILKITGPEFGKVGSNVKFTSSIEADKPLPDDLQYTWNKNGKVVPQYPGEETSTLELWDIDYPAEGKFSVSTTASDSYFNAVSNEIDFKIGEPPVVPDPEPEPEPKPPVLPPEPLDLVCPIIYDNPLPVRTSVYIWMGWWVIDEIIKAKADNFDWVKSPNDERFRYKCDIAKLAGLIEKYDHVEVQESRNGYILGKDFLQ